MPYYTHPDYKIYEFNKKLLQRTEVCVDFFSITEICSLAERSQTFISYPFRHFDLRPYQ